MIFIMHLIFVIKKLKHYFIEPSTTLLFEYIYKSALTKKGSMSHWKPLLPG